MKASHETPTRSFRLWAENKERLDYAANIGLNASQVVNEVLQQHLKGYLESARSDQQKRLKSALAQPIP